MSDRKLLAEHSDFAKEYDYEEGKLADSYYQKSGSTYPGISYECKKNVARGFDIWFRVEVDQGNNICAGFVAPYDDKAWQKGRDMPEEIQKQLQLNIDENRENGWWIYWEYLPRHDRNRPCNFKNANEQYLDLFDSDGFKKFIDGSVESIREMLNSLKY